MLKTFGSHLRGNLVGYVALFIALGGTTYAATGGNFLLGKPNSASSTTSLTAPVAGKGLQVTNTSTGAGATGLGLSVASGHTPFTVNSGTKVTNLNADKLDGLDSTSFVPSSGFRRVGPVTTTPAPVNGLEEPLVARIGDLDFLGDCERNHPNGMGHQVDVERFLITMPDHSAFASITQSGAGGTFGNGDTFAGDWPIADITLPTGTPNFNPITGSAVDPNGMEFTFNLYQSMNARNHPGECVFGGTIAVK
jgi:hypothetical protein